MIVALSDCALFLPRTKAWLKYNLRAAQAVGSGAQVLMCIVARAVASVNRGSMLSSNTSGMHSALFRFPLRESGVGKTLHRKIPGALSEI
jgi:hypothetical protein